jgi:hypothetical protein
VNETYSQPVIRIQPDTLFFATQESRTTLSISNTGAAVLNIDSMRTYRRYGWGLNVVTRDTVFAIDYCECSRLPFRRQLKFSLAPGDSAQLTFHAPDLCPVCKTSTKWYPFTDTLFIFSNDTLRSPARIFAYGEGIPSVIADREGDIPEGFALSQNYPNPVFRRAESRNSSTTIHFNLPAASQVTLKVYNNFGQEVRELAKQRFGIGRHQVNWDGRDNAGKLLASGVYFMRMTAESRGNGEFVQAKKMLLLE